MCFVSSPSKPEDQQSRSQTKAGGDARRRHPSTRRVQHPPGRGLRTTGRTHQWGGRVVPRKRNNKGPLPTAVSNENSSRTRRALLRPGRLQNLPTALARETSGALHRGSPRTVPCRVCSWLLVVSGKGAARAAGKGGPKGNACWMGPCSDQGAFTQSTQQQQSFRAGTSLYTVTLHRWWWCGVTLGLAPSETVFQNARYLGRGGQVREYFGTTVRQQVVVVLFSRAPTTRRGVREAACSGQRGEGCASVPNASWDVS